MKIINKRIKKNKTENNTKNTSPDLVEKKKKINVKKTPKQESEKTTETLQNEIIDIPNILTNDIELFKTLFEEFRKVNNISQPSEINNLIEWLQVDKFIEGYVAGLKYINKMEKVICEYGISNSMVLLINHYIDDIYDGLFDNEYFAINQIKKQTDAKNNYDMCLCILRKTIGQKVKKEIMGF